MEAAPLGIQAAPLRVQAAPLPSQAEVGKGLLETRRPHEYYLARLDELYGAAAPSEVRWEAE